MCFTEIDNLRDKYSDENDEEKLKFLDELNDYVHALNKVFVREDVYLIASYPDDEIIEFLVIPSNADEFNGGVKRVLFFIRKISTKLFKNKP